MQPEVVEKLVALREGIPRKEAKEVIIIFYFISSATMCWYFDIYGFNSQKMVHWKHAAYDLLSQNE